MTEAADPFESTRMSLGEHLGELRRRLVVGLLAVLVAFALTWAWREDAQRVVMRPYRQMVAMLEEHVAEETEAKLAADPSLRRADWFYEVEPGVERLRAFQDTRMQAVAPGEGFFFTLKVCVVFALFLGSPVLLWQLWQFVAAGLYDRERRTVGRYFPASLGLLLVGVGFGYALLVPYGMYFLARTSPIELVRPDYRVSDYFSFLSSLCLALGLVFQLPIAMTFLARTGVVDAATMRRYRRHVIVVIVVLAAILTPPDPYTQTMMAVPMLLLFEVGLVAARLAERRAAPAGTGGSPA